MGRDAARLGNDRTPGIRDDRSRLKRFAAILAASSLLVAGVVILVSSAEPNTDYIQGEPWLVVLDSGRIGIEFITYGAQYSTVLYGVLDCAGNWVIWPTPVTQGYGYSVYPSGAVMVSDSEKRVHVAWTLFDANRHSQTFYYVQLDRNGIVRARSPSLGSAPVASERFMNPVQPGIQVTGTGVDVVWLANGTYWVAPVDLQGNPTTQPFPTGVLGNESFPLRVQAPGGGNFDSSASAGTDGQSSLYVWRRTVFRQVGRTPTSEYELRFLCQGSGGPTERSLYSTADAWWWTAKPIVVPAVSLFVAGIVAVIIGAWVFTRGRSRV